MEKKELMSTENKRKNTKQNNAVETKKEPSRAKGIITDEGDVDELFKYNLDLINSWISNMDTKVSISCGIFSVILAVIVFTAENYFNAFDINDAKNKWLLSGFFISAITAAVFFVASIICHFIAITPSLLGKNKKEKAQFSIFYGNISRYETVEDYLKDAEKAKAEDFKIEIRKEIYYNSFICTKKVQKFKVAVVMGLISIAITLISIGFYYFSSVT